MIFRKTFSIFAYRDTDPKTFQWFRGGPVTLNFILDESVDLTGCTLLYLDVRESNSDSGASLLTKTTAPSGSSFSISLSTSETNFELGSKWLVLSAYFPGATSAEDNIDPIFVANLEIVPHNAYSV